MQDLFCARTTNPVIYILRRRGHFALCYLDDFFGVAATHEDAVVAYTDMMSIAAELELAFSLAKCTLPTHSLESLGYQVSWEMCTNRKTNSVT